MAYSGKRVKASGSSQADESHSGNWIAGAIGKPGALHAQMGIPQGEKIPAGKLAKAAKAGGTLGKRANLAITLRKMHKK